jgi:hypothetical protein
VLIHIKLHVVWSTTAPLPLIAVAVEDAALGAVLVAAEVPDCEDWGMVVVELEMLVTTGIDAVIVVLTGVEDADALDVVLLAVCEVPLVTELKSIIGTCRGRRHTYEGKIGPGPRVTDPVTVPVAMLLPGNGRIERGSDWDCTNPIQTVSNNTARYTLFMMGCGGRDGQVEENPRYYTTIPVHFILSLQHGAVGARTRADSLAYPDHRRLWPLNGSESLSSEVTYISQLPDYTMWMWKVNVWTKLVIVPVMGDIDYREAHML